MKSARRARFTRGRRRGKCQRQRLSARAPKSLETQISGESLLNDWIGTVVFLIVLQLASGESRISGIAIAPLFAEEAADGLLLGLCAGYLVYLMLRANRPLRHLHR